MTSLADLSKEYSTLVATADPSVVRIEARKRMPASGIVWSSDGLILTANHVVKRDGKISVGLADGTKTDGELVGRDPSTDLALIRIDAAGLSPFSRTATEEAAVGNIVFALARPGHAVQATAGIVSALGPSWRTHRGGQADRYIQTDVLMYPGFSGGPLVAADGSLVGMNSSALLHGISVTMPLATLDRVAAVLSEHGRVRRGYLGVSTQVVKLQEAMKEQLGQSSGLLIVSVESSSPADMGGLTIGDTIVKMGDSAIRRHDDLLSELVRADLDQKTPITFVRGGEVQTVNVKLGERD